MIEGIMLPVMRNNRILISILDWRENDPGKID